MAAANGVSALWIPRDGVMATPAVSAVIRERAGGVASGGFILTASHNPGGKDEDFGVKYNMGNGGPAPESVTDAIFEQSKSLDSFRTCALPPVDLATEGEQVFSTEHGQFTVCIIPPSEDYVAVLRRCFDESSLRALLGHASFSMTLDAMHGAAAAHAADVFKTWLQAGDNVELANCNPLEDFGGLHPDPNLVYAAGLVKRMGVTTAGGADDSVTDAPMFGAACDGDGDRNMVLGRHFFVSPSDSVAVIAHHAEHIAMFAGERGLVSVARSMPTSAALDGVAKAKGVQHLFETPTGWKFFCSAMDSAEVGGGTDYTPLLCGEESFGTGSSHIREKDGLWAILAWLSILAGENKAVLEGSAAGPLKGVQDVVCAFWGTYGRAFYTRYDYEGVSSESAGVVMAQLRDKIASFAAGGSQPEQLSAECTLSGADEFDYTDPVDGSTAKSQGLRFFFADGSRVVFRLSGTGSVGATIRMYIEKYVGPDAGQEALMAPTGSVVGGLVEVALQLSGIPEHTGKSAPSVIT